jgi:hypothetical protein
MEMFTAAIPVGHLGGDKSYGILLATWSLKKRNNGLWKD